MLLSLFVLSFACIYAGDKAPPLLGVGTPTNNATLLALRLINLEVWQLRTNGGVDSMEYAYSSAVVNFATIRRVVESIGSFSGLVAKEYDELVVKLLFILGYSPVTLTATWNPNTVTWLTPDIAQIDYINVVNNGYNATTGTYAFANQEFYQREIVTFDANSELINTGYSINDPGALQLFALTGSNIPVEALCGIIMLACGTPNNITGLNYLNDTGYSTFTDCYVALSQLPATQPCPFVQMSRTITCYQLHAFAAILLPSVHCSHVRAQSAVCKDNCLPACANCDVNARCVGTFPGKPRNATVVYKCQCSNGYIGNGTSCAPITCTNKGKCPANKGSYDCSAANRCECAPSFTPQPELLGVNDSLCVCLAPSQIVTYNKEQYCLPQGRCLSDDAREMCGRERYNEVKCLQQNNSFNTLHKCDCNYGFTGGVAFPCVCGADRRKVWSDKMDGKVCLNATECTEDWHCPRAKPDCQGATKSLVGQCVASRKRDI